MRRFVDRVFVCLTLVVVVVVVVIMVMVMVVVVVVVMVVVMVVVVGEGGGSGGGGGGYDGVCGGSCGVGIGIGKVTPNPKLLHPIRKSSCEHELPGAPLFVFAQQGLCHVNEHVHITVTRKSHHCNLVRMCSGNHSPCLCSWRHSCTDPERTRRCQFHSRSL